MDQLATTQEVMPLTRGKPIRLVIADDERDTVMTLGILLRSEGFEVQLVQNGAAVATAVGRSRPHAVVLDIGMPDRNGYEVAKELQASYGEKCPVLVAVSGRTSAEDRKQAFASGFTHYLTKPYDVGVLLQLLAGIGSETATA
ncbi:MAG TPA: response regulator [Burkholderiales bacterium]|nr:response regulator [Burkholderiales bacterium]